MDFTAILTVIANKAPTVIFVFGVLVFIHELGHFLAAKWAGIRVERFSLGFPPRMFGKKIGDTDYCISWIPLGGYVKMAGMLDESLDEKIEGAPDEFSSKPIWKRAIVIAAGPVMNIVLAVALFTGWAYGFGVPEAYRSVVKNVTQDSPAAQIGLKSGDRIVRINEQEINTWQEMTAIIQANPDKPLLVAWERQGQRMNAEVTPRSDNGLGRIGVEVDTANPIRRAVSFAEAFNLGINVPWRATVEMGRLLSRLVQGKESVGGTIIGPVGIVGIIGEAAQQGFDRIIELMAFLSINLAVVNLLPIPVLDGGHLVFLALEAIMRRPISIKWRVVIHQIAMALLLAFLVFITISNHTSK